MSRVRVAAFSISLDGYGAGPAQSEKEPLGVRGEELHPWLLQTRTFKQMDGGTVFHFVTGGIYVALQRAREAAGDRDIRIGGGVATVRQYLEARLIDELHLAVSPVLLGKGEHLLGGLDLPALGYTCTNHAAGKHAAHVTIEKDVR